MYSSMTEIQFTTYFNDILTRFYEDERDVQRLGQTLGFDVEKDYFMAIAFLYPSTCPTSFAEKERLKEQVSQITALPPLNRQIDESQYLYIEKGVATFLIGRTKQEIMDILPEFKEQALELLASFGSEMKVRIGIGLIESGIKGIQRTHENAVDAIRAGEIFKKERTVLEYLGMEIYSSINQMITGYGERLTRIVLKQIGENEQKVLAKYYKCKENIEETAKALEISTAEVEQSLLQVKENTGLDVNDTEDNFKLHLVMIAKKVLGANKKIEEVRCR